MLNGLDEKVHRKYDEISSQVTTAILLADYHTFLNIPTHWLLFCYTNLELNSKIVHCLVYSLGMQYSVSTADQDCITDVVNRYMYFTAVLPL